jgi:exosome complex exonuclease DIS3/RRP44
MISDNGSTAAIREAAMWYQQHLSPVAPGKKRKTQGGEAPQAPVNIILLSEDAGNRRAAEALGLQVKSVRDYVASMQDSVSVVLSDLVAQLGEISSANLTGQEGAAARGPKTTYAPDYLPQSTLQAGVKAGTLHQGYFNLDPYNFREGSVKVPSYGKPILLVGSENTNRSVTGDLVIVEVLDESEWRAPADEVMDEEGRQHSSRSQAAVG